MLPNPMDCRFTEREKDVLSLLVRAQTDKDISQILGISPRTARFHVSHILHKLGNRNRLELFASLLFANQLGQVNAPLATACGIYQVVSWRSRQ